MNMSWKSITKFKLNELKDPIVMGSQRATGLAIEEPSVVREIGQLCL